LLELLQDIDTELHVLSHGKLTDNRREINLQWFPVQLTNQVVYPSHDIRGTEDDERIRAIISQNPSLTNR
jgi:hypothetical protein